MKGIYGKKIGMTRYFTESGESVPVTVLEVTPNVVHQVKTKEKDGYEAVQVGVGSQKAQRVNKAETGHFSKAKKGMPRFVAEIRLDRYASADEKQYEVGDEIALGEMFAVGSRVDVMGITIGKGFAGVMKRHNMKGFPGSHGTHEYFRHGGSIGNRKFPGRVFKNKRMPGHMGVDQVVQEQLEVIAVRAEENLLLIRGSVPGAKQGFVFVREAGKGA